MESACDAYRALFEIEAERALWTFDETASATYEGWRQQALGVLADDVSDDAEVTSAIETIGASPIALRFHENLLAFPGDRDAFVLAFLRLGTRYGEQCQGVTEGTSIPLVFDARFGGGDGPDSLFTPALDRPDCGLGAEYADDTTRIDQCHIVDGRDAPFFIARTAVETEKAWIACHSGGRYKPRHVVVADSVDIEVLDTLAGFEVAVVTLVDDGQATISVVSSDDADACPLGVGGTIVDDSTPAVELQDGVVRVSTRDQTRCLSYAPDPAWAEVWVELRLDGQRTCPLPARS